MLRARLYSFLVGAGSGSAFYYFVDSTMLTQAGRANKRASEIREELIGFVSTPVKQAVAKANEVVLSPIQDQVSSVLSQKPDLKKTWNNGIQEAFGAASSLVGGGKS